MEVAYFYDMAGNPAMKKLLDQDFFKRIGPVVREAQMVGYEKEGFLIYIKARDDLVEEARKLLKESPAKPLEGESAEKVISYFREEAEAAEAGMGAIFG
ncbi:MAG: hypothetical protein A4E45_01593 [Methanosaeta sp. PtaB.Bin039]|nr:MAG: hypothetical protein A4E45_01593 [Methanosaeta sp. PtaB.Bin039]OPY45593.1 MAG: hypothetical protein A4E47_00902 [Methanosaeta sp. PtaU1.Bin028]HOT07266.1 hypothetical protein [Methanotrichaceae archaeon]HQF17294.1 hypothetical protein [Methanotrichaceae archaeon]HQI91867.1 hypothetical protein [Methanotrichaceae archaeon]